MYVLDSHPVLQGMWGWGTPFPCLRATCLAPQGVITLTSFSFFVSFSIWFAYERLTSSLRVKDSK